jgi:zinc protease
MVYFVPRGRRTFRVVFTFMLLSGVSSLPVLAQDRPPQEEQDFPVVVIDEPKSGDEQRAISVRPAGSVLTGVAEREGVLANGLRYRIDQTRVEPGRAVIRFIVKAGHFEQDTDQVEVAHWLEHVLASNYSREGKRVTSAQYVERWNGAIEPGAITLSDHTAYYYRVSADLVPEALDMARQIASGAPFTCNEVDVERSSVSAEARNSGEEHTKAIEAISKATGLSWAYPGLETTLHSLATTSCDKLQRFYADWYRPDLEMLVIAGDVDPAMVEAQLRERFADIKRATNPRPRPVRKADLPDVIHVSAVGVPVLWTVFGPPPQPVSSTATLRDRLVDKMVVELLNRRGERLGEHYASPTITVYFELARAPSTWSWYGTGQAGLTATIMPREGRYRDAATVGYDLIGQAARFGFTQAELDAAIAGDRLAKALPNRVDLISYYQQMGLVAGDTVIPTSEDKDKIDAMTRQITLAEVNAAARQWLKFDDRKAIFVTPPDSEFGSLDAKSIRSWMQSGWNKAKAADPQWAKISEVPQLDATWAEPTVMSVAFSDTGSGTQTAWLNNKIAVALKPLPDAKGKIRIVAQNDRGFRIYTGGDRRAARFATDIMANTGLAGLDKFELARLLKDRGVTVSLQSEYDRTRLTVNGSSEQSEFMLQLVNLYFSKPKISPAALEEYKETLRNRSKDYIGFDSLGGHADRVLEGEVLADSLTAQFIDPSILDQERTERLAYDQFGDPRAFTFVIAGDFDSNEILGKVAKYIGTLPASEPSQGAKPRLAPSAKPGDYTFQGPPGNAGVVMRYLSPAPDSEKIRITAQALGKVLIERMQTRLRTKERGVYTALGWARMNSELGALDGTISFQCAPQDVDRLIAAAEDEIAKMVRDGLTDAEKAMVAAAKSSPPSSPGDWAQEIVEQRRADPDGQITTIQPVETSPEAVVDLARQIFQRGNRYTFRLVPPDVSEKSQAAGK